MRTVFTHFFNEAYLLPWWLTHHRELFDEGVLIDYRSSDDSADICRTLAPHWRLVQSRNQDFDAVLADFEVMQYEAATGGWKMALTTTEFLGVAPDTLRRIEAALMSKGMNGVGVPAAIMVDDRPDTVPLGAMSLVQQKRWGLLQDDSADVFQPGGTISAPDADAAVQRRVTAIDAAFGAPRSRLFHRGLIGQYRVGRHSWQLPLVGLVAPRAATCRWYAFSPWQPGFIARKLQIKTRIPVTDQQRGFGVHHFRDQAALESLRGELLPHCRDLGVPGVVAAVDDLITAHRPTRRAAPLENRPLRRVMPRSVLTR